jgi:hypothetical protein
MRNEETTDERAVCGRIACTVRRAERGKPFDPYQQRIMLFLFFITVMRAWISASATFGHLQ